MSKILLITGGNGFLAQVVAKQAYANYQLVSLVKPSCRAAEHFQSIHQSLETLPSELPHVDVVIHLAACIPEPLYAPHSDLIATNVDWVAQHVLAYSVGCFGTPMELPLGYASEPNRPNPYGLSKLGAEALVRKVPNHAIIRFSSLIGPGMKVGNFIPAIVAAPSCDNVVVLGVDQRSYSNREVADTLAALTGAEIVHEGEDTSPYYLYEATQAMDSGVIHMDLRECLKKIVEQQ
jgi:nucleoside-diphosphate-sugar epimerase